MRSRDIPGVWRLESELPSLVNLSLFYEEIIFVICDIVLYLRLEYILGDFPYNFAYKVQVKSETGPIKKNE